MCGRSSLTKRVSRVVRLRSWNCALTHGLRNGCRVSMKTVICLLISIRALGGPGASPMNLRSEKEPFFLSSTSLEWA